ncbi:MAG: ABC transporter substrate-binding protein [Microcoleus sp. PH2017_29_MFU_D_A]|uniref:ABC transporter substrate-binding protein n=1 Tax=unclassified Microcoleus TaxID=2642155 RepID=UPI001D8AA70A|nr:MULTISPECIES: ABC transporter substrate-binding protein [unclassified Microcoleus]MCC3606795.1 ABC transporter substrate-binding protein [Microcoleus sp. PH2017_29_MFU_D_A]MCC3637838.1 ABC transporter substrate-binding protein [Microcoleus sp. PH2017_37_MFU_D_B]
MRLLKSWRLVLLGLVFGMAVVLSNCGTPANISNHSPTATTPATVPPGALVYGAGGPPVNLEPGNVTDGNSVIAIDQIYNRLTDSKPGTVELAPSLATEWSSSTDGKTWTFKLRSGVKFHDGTDFDADAVKFNVDRWWDAKNPHGYRDSGKTYQIWKNFFAGFKGDKDSLVKDVIVVDKSTIRFVLNRPFAAFPSAIGSGYFGIASPAAVKKAGAKYGTPGSLAVGTGPFVFKEWISGDRIILEKNPNYWKAGTPKVNQLVIRFVDDPAARLAQLRAGQLDFTVDLTPDQLKEVQADANLETVLRPSFNVGYLALNPGYAPLAKSEVRRAIAQTINKQAIVKAFWGELGKYDSQFIPPSLNWAESDKVKDYEFNPQQAKAMLAKAGYPNGFDLDLWYMPVSRPYFPTPKPIAEAFAADLSAIGIRVKLLTKDWSAYLADRLKPPGFQAFMMGWTGDYGDPDNFYYPHFGPGSTADLGNWKNPKVLELLDRGRASGDKAARGKIYAEVSEILHGEAVRLPIVHSQPLLGKRKNIKGWIPSPLGSESFEDVSKS